MTLDVLKERGTPLNRQIFTWREMTPNPISKLDSDAFTRARIIVMNGLETEQNRFLHSFARGNRELRTTLAQVRRVEQFQQTTVNWLLPPDQSPLETTIAYEQVAIELTSSIAENEPDPYLAQAHRFGLLEDFDHLYRFSALLDRVEGKDANTILQSYTDITVGRPTSLEHRAPIDDVRTPYARGSADILSKLNALTLVASENQTHDFYMNVGPMFPDMLGRALYAEIAAIEEQHVTHYESLLDPEESWTERWVLHELSEVYNYWSCVESEGDPRVKAIFERFLDYELGHLHIAMDVMRQVAGQDPESIVPASLPSPIAYRSHREFVREVNARERDYRANGPDMGLIPESEATLRQRAQLNGTDAPSDIVASNYRWYPGTELNAVSESSRAA